MSWWRRALRRLPVLLCFAVVAVIFGTHTRSSLPPHAAEWLAAGDAQVRALRAGQGDTTVVFIHGFGDNLVTWRAVLDPIARRYRVLAFDLPGFGASDKPAGPYTLDAMVGRVRALLGSATTGPLILVGHSMGGEIAAATALAEPERVTALVLIAPAGFEVGLGGIADSMTPGKATAISRWEAVRAGLLPLHDPAWFSEPEGRKTYDPAFDSTYRAATEALLEQFDFTGIGPRATGIRQPVLLIWGTADPVIPFRVAAEVMALLPCRRLDVLDRALHRPQVERPDTVGALILGFLARPGCQ